jgi:hypothetical protein
MVLINRAAGVISAVSAFLTIDTGARTITNGGLIEAAASGRCTIQSSISNYGTLEAANGGLVTVNGAVLANSGKAAAVGGTLDFTSTFNQDVLFQGAGSVLELAQSQTYSGKLQSFSNTGESTLDLADIAFVSAGEATYSGTAKGGVLTVTDGTHTAHIGLTGSHLGATFTASSDGHGGTDIVASSNKVARFIQAVAGASYTSLAPVNLIQEPRQMTPIDIAGPRTSIT